MPFLAIIPKVIRTESPLIISWQKTHMVLSPNESDWDCHAPDGRMNPISAMNIIECPWLLTQMQCKILSWGSSMPHKENGFSYSSTSHFCWKYSVWTDDWELSVEWWVSFCRQLWNVSLLTLMDCQQGPRVDDERVTVSRMAFNLQWPVYLIYLIYIEKRMNLVLYLCSVSQDFVYQWYQDCCCTEH